MNNLRQLAERLDRIGRTIDRGGEPPEDGDMDARIAKLETDVTAIKIDVAVIKLNGATKTDVAEAKSSIILWIASAIFVAQLIPTVVRLAEKYI